MDTPPADLLVVKPLASPALTTSAAVLAGSAVPMAHNVAKWAINRHIAIFQ